MNGKRGTGWGLVDKLDNIFGSIFCLGWRVYQWLQLSAQLSAQVRLDQLRKLKNLF